VTVIRDLSFKYQWQNLAIELMVLTSRLVKACKELGSRLYLNVVETCNGGATSGPRLR